MGVQLDLFLSNYLLSDVKVSNYLLRFIDDFTLSPSRIVLQYHILPPDGSIL